MSMRGMSNLPQIYIRYLYTNAEGWTQYAVKEENKGPIFAGGCNVVMWDKKKHSLNYWYDVSIYSVV